MDSFFNFDSDAKASDKEKIIKYLYGKSSVLVDDIIDNSGASKIRVYSVLYELQLENVLMVVEEERFGSPKVVALVDGVRPKEIFSPEFFEWMMLQASNNPRKRWNYNLHHSLQEPVQRLLYALIPGTVFMIHKHINTDETYALLRGSVDLVLYSDSGKEHHRVSMSANNICGAIAPQGQFHSLEVREPSIILLVKNGPYDPSVVCLNPMQ